MLIQRSAWPSRTSSTISTLGASGSGGRAETAPRDRAVRRRRGLGRFGTGTSGLVAQHVWLHNAVYRRIGPFRRRRLPTRRGWMVWWARHSWTHPEGWRDWPDETPATARRASDGNGANS